MSIATIQACELPANALLRDYLKSGSYADCYTTEILGVVTQAEFVEAFYTSRVFKLERGVLALLAGRPSNDEQVRQLAAGHTTSFAAWDVEGREDQQILLSDFLGRTRSWLMSAPSSDAAGTQLFFGSAVVPVVNRRTGKKTLALGFEALLGFHRLYATSCSEPPSVVWRAKTATGRCL